MPVVEILSETLQSHAYYSLLPPVEIAFGWYDWDTCFSIDRKKQVESPPRSHYITVIFYSIES